MKTPVSETLLWLNGYHWVKFDGEKIIQGYRPYEANYVVSGVEQIDLKRVYINDNFEIWHKSGRKVWSERGSSEYEPSVFILVENKHEMIDDFLGYEVVDMLMPKKRYLANLERLKQDHHI